MDEVTKANPGMASLKLNIDDPDAIRSFAAEVTGLHPTLNVLINNAGIMRPENLKAQRVADAEATTSAIAPYRAFLEAHLAGQYCSFEQKEGA